MKMCSMTSESVLILSSNYAQYRLASFRQSSSQNHQSQSVFHFHILLRQEKAPHLYLFRSNGPG